MTEEEKRRLMELQKGMMGNGTPHPSPAATPSPQGEGLFEGIPLGPRGNEPLSGSFGASSPQGEPVGHFGMVGSGVGGGLPQSPAVTAPSMREPLMKVNSIEAKIGAKEVNEAAEILMKYKQGKAVLENRIVEEERWWKLRHWESMNSDVNRPKPTSAWMFNSVANKHADAMDNYPEPNILPRARDDEQSAETLSSVVPVIMERNNFEKVYSDAWWYKLKHGVSCYGAFWNNDLEDGLGDVEVVDIDILNVFWEPGVTDIHDSRNLFIVSFADEDVLKQRYSQLKDKNITGNVLDIKEYVHDENIDKTDKAIVVDWYYKSVNEFGRAVLHYCKFIGDTVLFATENEEKYADVGWYEHGKYPIVFDVLYPEADSPAGFGLVSITRDPQMYIDKLQQLILENAAYVGRPRYWVRKDGGVNEEEFLDMSKTLVHVEGSIDEERLRKIDVDGMPAHILNLLQFKIDELKDTSSNHDVNQGQTASGVTSGAAIAALQETGNKVSRDMLAASYRAYTQVIYLVIELIRQFYDEARSFRITGNNGQAQFIEMGNQDIKAIEGGRKPIFDVVVKPQKRSAYSKLSQNDLMIQMYQLGLLHPQNADAALVAVEGMEFDGKQKMIEQLQQGQTMYMQLQQMGQQMQMQSAQMEKMATIIEKLTGQSVMNTAPSHGTSGTPSPTM